MQIRTHKVELDARGLRIGIVVSRFNEFITEELMRGAIAVLERHGCPEVSVVKVPGAWELPLAAQSMMSRCDAVIALGAVVRGDTPHFDFVAAGMSDGIQHASLRSGKPIAFGVLTTDTMQQAMDRAGGKSGNKGAEAAEVAIEMAVLLRSLKEGA